MSGPTERSSLLENNAASRAQAPWSPSDGNTSATDAPVHDDDGVHVYCVRPYPQSPIECRPQASLNRPVVINAEESLKPLAFRESWQTLLRHDTGFIFSNLGALVKTAWLSISTKPRHGTERYNPSKRSAWGGKLLIVVSGVLTIPIAAGIVLALPPYLLLRLFTRLAEAFQGNDTRLSLPPNDEFVQGHEREAWLFVNGIATAPSGAQATANYLQHIVKRPVTAILNRTMGAWFDLWECFMQRDMLLCTRDVREGYQELVKHVTDMSKERIVLIGHSQGGIIVSAWVDQLLTDFDESILSRVEVYTFASAANHFSRGGRYVVENGSVKRLDPPKGRKRDGKAEASSTPTDSGAPKNGPFRFVEHYANSGDFVAQLGVLSHKPTPAGSATETFGVFAGQIFERKNQEGHGILDFYLGLGEGQTSILDVPSVALRSRLASYAVTASSNGNPLPFVAPE